MDRERYAQAGASELRRVVMIGALAVAVGLLAVVLLARHFVREDRWSLLQRHSQARLGQVERAAAGIEEDLRDIVEDLDFTVRVLHTLPDAPAEERLLTAMVSTVRPYRAVVAVTLQPRHVARVADPRGEGAVPAETLRLLEQIAFAAAHGGGNLTQVSAPVEIPGEGWFRIFTAAWQDTPDEHGAHALALLVDLRHYFARLRYISTEVQTDVLVLGPEGPASRATDPAVRAAVEAVEREPTMAPVFAAALERMRDGEVGTVVLERRESASLGFGRADTILAFAPVGLGRHARWAVATISSMAEFRGLELALVRRLVLSATGVAVLLVVAFAYLLVLFRRAVRLHEQLANADRLAHLHEKAERILDSIPVGVLGVSADGRVTAANRALRQRLPELALPVSLDAVFPGAEADARAALAGLVEAAERHGATVPIHGAEWRLFPEPTYLRVQAVPLSAPSEELRTLLVLEDLTAVHRLETQLLRAEKLATVGTLAAGFAHEIGTPLGVIRGRAEMTLSKLASDAPQSESLRIIIEQIDRVARIVQSLLDFSRARPASRTQVALPQLGARIAELLAFEATRRGVRLEMTWPADLPLLPGDADQLEQLLLNLVVNALDASPRGGLVEVSARMSAAGPAPARVQLIVADQGSGIAPTDLHRIFDPFFTTKKRGQGTGLGLTMVAKIARDHGATIDVESTPGLGTRFVVDWPLGPPAEGEDRGR